MSVTFPTDWRIKRGWMNLRVTEIIEETLDTKTFVLINEEEKTRAFDYIGGQYLTFRFDTIAAKPIVRSYTMSSSPCQADFSAFTVKRVEGGVVSNWLCDTVKTGDILRARGPIGRFCYDTNHDYRHLFMIAGGSGVTPFISIARQYADLRRLPSQLEKMTLLVSYRTEHDLICAKELRELEKARHVKVIITLSRSQERSEFFWHGRIDDTLLTQAIAGNYGQTTFMTCGPEAMMATVASHLKTHGVAEDHIKMESFAS